MRTRQTLVLGCLVMFTAVVASAGGHNKALMEEVEALGDALSKAMVENDVDFLLGLYAEGAISLPNYGPRMQGMDAFKKSPGSTAFQCASISLMTFSRSSSFDLKW